MQLEDLKESHLESVFLSFTSFSIHDDNWSSQIQSSLCGLVKHYIESKGCCSSSNPWGCIQSRSYSRMNFTHVPTSCLTERCIENLLGFTEQLSRGKMFPKPQKRQIVGVQKKCEQLHFCRITTLNTLLSSHLHNNGFELAKMTGDTYFTWCVGHYDKNPTFFNVCVSVFCTVY